MDFVLFQSASVMRDAVMREWQILTAEEKAELRQYLLHFLTSRTSLTSYVQRQLVHMLALMVKRTSLEPGFQELFRSILDFVAQMLGTGDVKMVRVIMSYVRRWRVWQICYSEKIIWCICLGQTCMLTMCFVDFIILVKGSHRIRREKDNLLILSCNKDLSLNLHSRQYETVWLFMKGQMEM